MFLEPGERSLYRDSCSLRLQLRNVLDVTHLLRFEFRIVLNVVLVLTNSDCFTSQPKFEVRI